MNDITKYTESDYQAAIPACCSMQTMEEHKDMGFCWGLSVALSRGGPMFCYDCELRKEAA